MPIRKFHAVEEMSEPVWLPIGPDLWNAIDGIGQLGRTTVGHQFPPGVYKHRTVTDAQVLRGKWEAENIRRYQARLAALTATARRR